MQVKVVMIDDNPVTIRSLIQTIDWEGLGCVIAGAATDGESGKELVLKLKPDILLLDIRMPHKDGLEMLQEVRQAVPQCKVIIITGYDRFQYASQAIKLSVFDYILKPIRNSEVIEVVRRALEQMQRDRSHDLALSRAQRLTARVQLLSLVMNQTHSGQNVHQMLTEAGLHSERYLMMVVHPAAEQPLAPAVYDRVDELLASGNMRALTLSLYDTPVIYLMLDKTNEDWRAEARRVQLLIAPAFEPNACIGVSDLGTSHHGIRHAYHQARQALWQCTLSGRTDIAFYSADEVQEGGVFERLQQRLEDLAESTLLEEASIRRAAQTLRELSGRQYTNLRALVSLYIMLLLKKYPCNSAHVDRHISAALFVSTPADVDHCLLGLCDAMRAEQSVQQEKNYSLMTRSVLEYIRVHGAETLRLSDIADRFHINMNYLSLLIKRETGVTFHDHVLRAKMDIAHTMLADPRVRVAEVAHAVGYSNYVSFYNTFKRLEHMTPTEYRNKVEPGLPQEDAEDPAK